jgi:pimeloyl-ACP methyl ester carboxylesterase
LLGDVIAIAHRNAFEASEIARLLAEKAPDNLASLRGFFSREPQATTAALLQAIAADGPGVSEEDLRNLEIPTLIIGHDIDYIRPLSYAAAVSQLIPDCCTRLAPEMAQAGLFSQKPDAFTRSPM